MNVLPQLAMRRISLPPLVDFGIALEAPDVAKLGARIK
jgi:hypothetical protein